MCSSLMKSYTPPTIRGARYIATKIEYGFLPYSRVESEKRLIAMNAAMNPAIAISPNT